MAFIYLSICNFPYFLTDKQKTPKSAGNSNYPNFDSDYHHFRVGSRKYRSRRILFPAVPGNDFIFPGIFGNHMFFLHFHFHIFLSKSNLDIIIFNHFCFREWKIFGKYNQPYIISYILCALSIQDAYKEQL